VIALQLVFCPTCEVHHRRTVASLYRSRYSVVHLFVAVLAVSTLSRVNHSIDRLPPPDILVRTCDSSSPPIGEIGFNGEQN
jgi:hypothetical protein